jgi:hypothetical protein
MALTIKKTLAYVWRCNVAFGYQGMSHIPVWSVWDGAVELIGGHYAGYNQKSGYAYCPRRKDAVAFIDGYEAQLARGVVTLTGNGSPYLDRALNPYNYGGAKYAPKSDGQARFFENGARAAFRIQQEG